MKAIVLYIVLVGLPVLGVIGLLRLGAGLTAPVSVGGTWAVKLTAPAASSAACGDLPPYLAASHLMIAQSGPSLQLTLDDAVHTKLAGQILGDTITATGQGAATGSRAPDAPRSEIQFEAHVGQSPMPTQLQGTLGLGGCSAPLAGNRQPAAN